MNRPIRSLLLVGISLLLAAVPLHAGEGKKDPKEAYALAADYFGKLDLDKALRWAGIVLRDAKGTPEAQQAALLKTLVSTVQLQKYKLAAGKYVEAMRKAVIRNERRRCRDAFLEATAESVYAGEMLTGDVNRLLPHVGKKMTIEIKKGFNSLELYKAAYMPYKMLDHGRPPTAKEGKDIEKHLSCQSFHYVMSRLLHGPNPGSASVVREFEKLETVKGSVDWAGVMTAAGEWLVQYAAVCQVGWMHPKLNKVMKDPEAAREGYLAARQCFEKVRELTKDLPLGAGGARADEQIEEIDKMLKELGKAEKPPASERDARG